MPAGSFVTVAGTFTTDQCRIGAPRATKSVSCMMIAYDLVEAGPLLHSSPGNSLPLYCVYLKSMSAPSFQPGVVTVSFAPSLAGSVTMAARSLPASTAGGGGACAKAGAATITAAASATADAKLFMAFLQFLF